MAGMTYEDKIDLVSQHLPGTVTQIAQKSGLSPYTTKDTLARMRGLGLAKIEKKVREPAVWHGTIDQ